MTHSCTQSLLNWGQTVKLMSSSPDSEDHCLHLKKKKLHNVIYMQWVCSLLYAHLWRVTYIHMVMWPLSWSRHRTIIIKSVPMSVDSQLLLGPPVVPGIDDLLSVPGAFFFSRGRNGVMESSGTGVWLLSLSIMQMRSSSLVHIWVVPSYSQVACEDAWMDHQAYSFNSRAGSIWNLGCFQFGAIMNKAAIILHVQVFVWTYAFIFLG